MSDDLHAVHNELLSLMDIVDRMCRTNSINYSLHAGTMLGAVRERGFIPWDDDIDISLTRDQYEKLAELLRRELGKDNTNELSFDDSFGPRIFLKRANKPIVWIDIYTYDYISSNRTIQKIKFLVLAFLMAWSRDKNTLKVTQAHGMYKGVSYWIIWFVHVLGLPFSKAFKNRISLRAAKSFPGNRMYIHRANDQYVALKLVLPKECMESYEDIEFEGRNYMITTKHHEVLTSSYGSDYMIPRKQNNDIESHDLFRSQAEEGKIV